MTQPQLVVLYGPPGVGKLTVAKELVKLTEYKLFHNHLSFNLVHSLYEYGTSEFRDLLQHLRFEVFQSVSTSSIKGLIFTWVYDKNNVNNDNEFILKVQSIFKNTVFIKLTCTSEELERRLTNESRLKDGKLNSVVKLAKAYEGKSVDEVISFVESMVIDSTDKQPSEVAKLIHDTMKVNK